MRGWRSSAACGARMRSISRASTTACPALRSRQSRCSPICRCGSAARPRRRSAELRGSAPAGRPAPKRRPRSAPVIAGIRAAAAAEGRAIDDDHYGAGIPFRFGRADDPGLDRLFDAYRKRTGRDPSALFRDRRRRGGRRARRRLCRGRRLEIHPAPGRPRRRRDVGPDPPADRGGPAACRGALAKAGEARRTTRNVAGPRAESSHLRCGIGCDRPGGEHTRCFFGSADLDPCPLAGTSPSSRGLGHRPFTAVTGVRIPLGTPINPIP